MGQRSASRFKFEDAAIGAPDEFGAEKGHAVQGCQERRSRPNERSSGNKYTPCTEFQMVDASNVRAQPGRIRVHAYVSNRSAGRR